MNKEKYIMLSGNIQKIGGGKIIQTKIICKYQYAVATFSD